jgi:hypothetical protein
MIIGALLSMQKATIPTDRRPRRSGRAACSAPGLVFQRVVFAQAWISLINTFHLDALDIVLSLFGVELPLVKTTVALPLSWVCCPSSATLSNTAIVIVCLSQGLPVAIASLVFLVATTSSSIS